MTEPGTGELPGPDEQSLPDPAGFVAPGRRLRAIPALAVASMLVAGGLLLAVGGIARLVGPAPPTPTPTVAPTTAPTNTLVAPSTNPLGPTAAPQGDGAPRTAPV